MWPPNLISSRLKERREELFATASLSFTTVSPSVLCGKCQILTQVQPTPLLRWFPPSLDTNNVTVKKQVLELLSALCVYNAEGYSRALDALQHYKELKGERYRLNVVVSELRDATSVEYQNALVAFINCLIISTPQLKDRIRIRNEFIGDGSQVNNYDLGDGTQVNRYDLGDGTQINSYDLGDGTQVNSYDLGDGTQVNSYDLGDGTQVNSYDLGD
uniref:Formin FH3 domain-containing protein n=1 Tax=Timema monikensis TaxID=170555 RepID=A0A7R9HN72_9NEOP|nr:unnamed protein product [Timema monikensis]